MRDRGPKVVTTERGECWEINGERRRIVGVAASAGRAESEKFSREGVGYAEILPGTYDAKARLADMDADGVAVEIIYANLPGFGGATFVELAEQDPDIALACVKVYNEWLAVDWCSVAPNRLIPQCILPLWDLAESGREAARAIELGHRAVQLPPFPWQLDLPPYEDPAWEPVFDTCSNAGVPVVMHIGGSKSRRNQTTQRFPGSGFVLETSSRTMGHIGNSEGLAALMFGGTLDKYPQLKVVSAESGIGWIPAQLERMDDLYHKYGVQKQTGASLLPSEYFRRQVFATFILDDFGMKMRDEIGVDKVMWSSDYPHADSTWPDSRRILAERYGYVPAADMTKIVRDNAVDVYGIKLPLPAARP
jgi:predicted TIM-barrel fold metal-dependent hydrolase